ncbi:MAG: deoxyhypusine synthase [Candidatus Woesearchaeota archaeon]|nr:deoxyhypusine synthase [Candidatus Woesearchaeota archaeon]
MKPYPYNTEDDATISKYDTLEGFPEVKGYDFEQEFDFAKFISSFSSMGIQATNLSKGIDITKAMFADNATIFLSCTSNMISSGNRELIKYLVKHKKIHAIVTSAGGVEEDIIKCLKPFVLGNFDIPGRVLFEKGVGRIGNIFAPFDRYLYFEKFMNTFWEGIHNEQAQGTTHCPSDITKKLGEAIDNEESILYWAAKNDIPVFCPAITDGSLGDLMHFQKMKKDEFVIDVVGDHSKIVKMVLASEKTGALLLGGGVAKHYVLNANIFRDGLDYAVYITTATEYDASDSGGNPQEAITWAKIKPQGEHVKIHCEASIAFPLLVAGVIASPSQ